MKSKQLGNTDVFITELAFGAWAIGGWQWGGSDSREALRAMEASIDNGMTSIDTAPIYGFGLSEEIAGKAAKGKRSNVQILTKCGMNWQEKKGEFFFKSRDNSGNSIDIHKYSGRESILLECENSLRRLKTDYIDLYQVHWPDNTTPVHETMEALALLLKQGKIRSAGVSNYSCEWMDEALKTFPIVTNQIAYSMVNRDAEKDIIPFSIEHSIGIIAYSPLQRGLLAGKIKKDHVFREGDTRPFTMYYREPNFSRILDLTEKLGDIANRDGLSLSQLVLIWTTRQPGITCTLTGARNENQVLENIKAAESDPGDDTINEINSLLSGLKIEKLSDV
ncbi:MAG TPA: aldo/keto reductase [Bacteroidales bacterium]|nr:aldo/keto reductase [Bacteroidales bacterium]